jgi:hypothetical protein
MNRKYDAIVRLSQRVQIANAGAEASPAFATSSAASRVELSRTIAPLSSPGWMPPLSRRGCMPPLSSTGMPVHMHSPKV